MNWLPWVVVVAWVAAGVVCARSFMRDEDTPMPDETPNWVAGTITLGCVIFAPVWLATSAIGFLARLGIKGKDDHGNTEG